MTEVSKKKVVIIGGGTGGVIVANVLAHKGGTKFADTVLLSTSDRVYYEPDNLFRLFDKKGMESQFKLIRKVVDKKVKVETATVTNIDPGKRFVKTKDGVDYPYDYLVIATGASYDYGRVPGYKDIAHNFHEAEATLKLREALESFQGGNILMSIADIPFKCPVSPLEFCLMARAYFKKRGMLDKVKFHITSPLPRLFSIENVSNKMTKRFEKSGIEIHTFFNTETIDPEKKVVTSLEGEKLPFDLLIMVPPHNGAEFLKTSGIGDDEGWVTVDRETLRHNKFPEIFAVGDATNLPVSKAGAAAHHQAKIIGPNIASILKGEEPKKKYDGHVQCFLMTSLKTSIFLDFNYHHPPRRYGLFSNTGWYIAKRLFKPMFFRLVLSGRV